MFNHDKELFPVSLTTVLKDVTLRKLQISDAEELFSLLDKHRVFFSEYLYWVDRIQTVEDEAAYIKRYVDRPEYTALYGVYLRNELTGVRTVRVDRNEDGTTDATVSIFISPDFAGNHLQVITGDTMIRHFQSTGQVNRVIADILHNNKRSQRGCEKLGMEKYGEIEVEGKGLFYMYEYVLD